MEKPGTWLFTGLVIASCAIGTEDGAAAGCLVFGFGLMALGILKIIWTLVE